MAWTTLCNRHTGRHAQLQGWQPHSRCVTIWGQCAHPNLYARKTDLAVSLRLQTAFWWQYWDNPLGPQFLDVLSQNFPVKPSLQDQDWHTPPLPGLLSQTPWTQPQSVKEFSHGERTVTAKSPELTTVVTLWKKVRHLKNLSWHQIIIPFVLDRGMSAETHPPHLKTWPGNRSSDCLGPRVLWALKIGSNLGHQAQGPCQLGKENVFSF